MCGRTRPNLTAALRPQRLGQGICLDGSSGTAEGVALVTSFTIRGYDAGSGGVRPRLAWVFLLGFEKNAE